MLVAVLIAQPPGGMACGGKPSKEQAASGTAHERTTQPRLRTGSLTLADRRLWRDALQWPDDCEKGFHAADSSSAGLELFTLTGGHLLAQVRCSLGAYQPTHIYYVVESRANPRGTGPLEFQDYVDSGVPGPKRLSAERTTEVVGLPTYLSGQNKLQIFRRFRGVGDCGLVLTYEIVRTQTVLREARGKLDCDGRGPRDPADWPALTLP